MEFLKGRIRRAMAFQRFKGLRLMSENVKWKKKNTQELGTGEVS